mgnify:CR=1 FL=1
MGKLFVMDHPLIQHKLSHMRDKNTGSKEFRELLNEISMLMAYEVTRDLPLVEVEVETPITTCKTKMLAGKKLGVVPILRAGLGMADGFLELMPSARVGHIGMYRDENKRPVEYLVKLPDLEGRTFFLVDPMLATGYSAAHGVDVLKKRGVKGENIIFMSLLCAPEGIETFQKLHPDVDVYTASLDDHLNEKAYIVPGLGDAGDRLYGTL